MEKRLLPTRSNHDIANQYLYAYSEEILDAARSLGWKSDSVDGEKNRKHELESRIAKTRPDFLFLNGHGNDDSVCGHANETLLDSSSAGMLKGKVVYARSCSALNGLGKEAAGQGCKAFIGYRGSFLIPRTNEYESTPLRDNTAKPVLEVSNSIGKHILNGASAGEAVDSAKRMSAELILKMLSSQEPYDAATLRALYQNMSVLSLEGNRDAKA